MLSVIESRLNGDESQEVSYVSVSALEPGLPRKPAGAAAAMEITHRQQTHRSNGNGRAADIFAPLLRMHTILGSTTALSVAIALPQAGDSEQFAGSLTTLRPPRKGQSDFSTQAPGYPTPA